MYVQIIAAVFWNLESTALEMAMLDSSKSVVKQITPVSSETHPKPDMHVKRSSESDLTTQGSFKRDLKAKRFSQPELINRRPFKSDLIKTGPHKHASGATQKETKSISVHKDKIHLISKIDDDKSAVHELQKSTAETDSYKILLTISKIPTVQPKPTSNKTEDAKTVTLELKQDSKHIAKDKACTELGALRIAPEVKTNEPDISETDNKSTVSDSGLGSEYSIRTVKTDVDLMGLVEDKKLESEEAVSQVYKAENTKSNLSNLSWSGPTKLFEIESSVSQASSRTNTIKSRPKTPQRDGKKSDSIGTKKIPPSKKKGNHGDGYDSSLALP